MKYIARWLLLLFVLCAPVARAMNYSEEHLKILSRLQEMAQGSYTASEWNTVAKRLDDVLEHARQNQDWNAFVETQVIRANVMTMRGSDDQALALLQKTLADFETQDVSSLKKVYVEIAAAYARRGDQAAVTETMNRFKKSRHYDRETYAFSGGDGPNDPIVVARPSVGVDASISMTAMNMYRTQAEFGPGQNFPDFSTPDWSGRTLSLDGFRGQVVLIDFWAAGWFIWNRDLANRMNVYSAYQREGFEIIGLNIDADEATARAFVTAKNIPWPQANAPRELQRTLGIFGEAANFLLNRDGTIIGRNLYGSELNAAVRRAVAH